MRNSRRISGIIAIFILMTIIIGSIFADKIAPYDPNAQNPSRRLEGFSEDYRLGTDALGRDMLSRIIHGAKTSIVIALTATIISMLIGTIIGTISGYYGGRLDYVLTSISNIFQALPQMCFVIAIAGILGPNMKNLILALSITSWAGFSRIIRTEILKEKEEAYVEAMICLGSSDLSIILKHIIPNIFPNIIILFTTRTGRAILSIASLSFLGLGVQPPAPDWSVMINDARLYYRSYPHLIIIPGLFIFITLMSINMIGDFLRDIFDVRSEEII